jgi:hypothetical protein
MIRNSELSRNDEHRHVFGENSTNGIGSLQILIYAFGLIAFVVYLRR